MAVVFVVLLAGGAAPVRAAVCTTVPVYPGDAAPAALLAAWMATGAARAALPGELPVMGALVESGLHNLNFGDADAVGFFQLRRGIWDQGPYAGYPGNPELQLRWFTDFAVPEGRSRATAGIDNGDPATWGEWVADVLSPPDQFRGRYQLQLGQASELIAAGCPPAAPGPVPQWPAADTVAPTLGLRVPARRRGNRPRRVALRVTAGSEAARVVAHGTLVVAGRRRPVRLARAVATLAAGQSAALRLRIPRAARGAVWRALRERRAVRARLAVTATDAAGNKAVQRRTLRLSRAT